MHRPHRWTWSAFLTNETSYRRKKRIMHLNWAIHNAWLKYRPPCSFFPTLSHDRDQPTPLKQPEACPQHSKRPVCARSPHRSRIGYPGWCIPTFDHDLYLQGHFLMSGSFARAKKWVKTDTPWCSPLIPAQHLVSLRWIPSGSWLLIFWAVSQHLKKTSLGIYPNIEGYICFG